jgi:hypothetical protein
VGCETSLRITTPTDFYRSRMEMNTEFVNERIGDFALIEKRRNESIGSNHFAGWRLEENALLGLRIENDPLPNLTIY